MNVYNTTENVIISREQFHMYLKLSKYDLLYLYAYILLKVNNLF